MNPPNLLIIMSDLPKGLLFALASTVATADDTIKMVVERPAHFSIAPVKNPREMGYEVKGTRWRNDHELVFEAFRYREWRAQGAWDQRVFRWNIDSGDITPTPYVGSVECLTEKRIVLRRDVPDQSDIKGKKQRHVYSVALFGEPAIQSSSIVYNEYSCEPQGQRALTDETGRYRVTPLNSGHGKVYRDLRIGNENVWYLPEGSSQRIQIGAGKANSYGEEIANPGDVTPRYLPWLGEYLFGGHVGDHRQQRMWTYDVTLYFLSPDGKMRVVHEPALINEWKKKRLSASYVVTAAGVVWILAGPSRGAPTEYDGLYIERQGKLVRFLRHASLRQHNVSPGSGCRALTVVDSTGRNFPHDQATEQHLIDFCKEASL